MRVFSVQTMFLPESPFKITLPSVFSRRRPPEGMGMDPLMTRTQLPPSRIILGSVCAGTPATHKSEAGTASACVSTEKSMVVLERLHGSLHIAERLLAPHPNVIIVFLAHQLLEHAHHLIALMLDQKIDHLNADPGVLFGQQRLRQNLASIGVRSETLQALQRLEANAGIGVVLQRIHQRAAYFGGFGTALEDADGFHAQPEVGGVLGGR